jgi:hypothetical protein
MRQQWKKYGSIFLLLLFLFPLVEKQLHLYDHVDDNRCLATDKHFHEQEHSCRICEFTITDSGLIPDVPFQLIPFEETGLFYWFIQNIHTPDAFQDIPSRAPPVC